MKADEPLPYERVAGTRLDLLLARLNLLAKACREREADAAYGVAALHMADALAHDMLHPESPIADLGALVDEACGGISHIDAETRRRHALTLRALVARCLATVARRGEIADVPPSAGAFLGLLPPGNGTLPGIISPAPGARE